MLEKIKAWYAAHKMGNRGNFNIMGATAWQIGQFALAVVVSITLVAMFQQPGGLAAIINSSILNSSITTILGLFTTLLSFGGAIITFMVLAIIVYIAYGFANRGTGGGPGGL